MALWLTSYLRDGSAKECVMFGDAAVVCVPKAGLWCSFVRDSLLFNSAC